MDFHETLTLRQSIFQRNRQKRTFYGRKSTALRIAEGVLKITICGNARQLGFGYLHKVTQVRRNAYENARAQLAELPGSAWLAELSKLLGVNFKVIYQKLFFDELYQKFEFYEIAKRYVLEHGYEAHAIEIDSAFAEAYMRQSWPGFDLKTSRSCPILDFLTGLALIPVYLMYQYVIATKSDEKSINDAIVCFVDGDATVEMFKTIFRSSSNIRFVTEEHYKHYGDGFSERVRSESRIISLRLSRTDFAYLISVTPRYIYKSLRAVRELAPIGINIFWLFVTLAKGKALALNGENNVLFTFEHLSTVKAARNEFLRANGSKSVFVPKDTYAIDHRFAAEYLYNYDVLCSPGRALETAYQMQCASTPIFLRTGSYDTHRPRSHSQLRVDRIAKLKEFKDGKPTITILSPGICELTINTETRLMQLAVELAKQFDIRVFVRLKPMVVEPQYSGFYDEYDAASDRILITGSEFDLFDFLDVSDLFVTSLSSSAVDVAQRGGKFVSVDFADEADLYLWMSYREGICISEEKVGNFIREYLFSRDAQGVRAKHDKAINELVEFIGYKFESFDAYVDNLLKEVTPHLPASVSCGNLATRQ